jgi:predicted dehydrogenase
VLVPALRDAGFSRLIAVASASGLSAARLAARLGFERAVSGANAVIDDPDIDVVVVVTEHDKHADLVAAALRAGKHVFCEKPLALTEAELDSVEEALATSEAVLFVGFNRRWSDAVESVRQHVGHGVGPLVLTYRVNAGAVAAAHWYNDRRQGGRLLGEVCHFVDTCAAIVGEEAVDVHVAGTGKAAADRALADNLALVLSYGDGSVAAITYATGGHHSVEKERLEVLGRGRSAAIVDFREVYLDGRRAAVKPGKGHAQETRAFREAIRAGNRSVSIDALATTRTTLRAAAKLTGA